MANEKRFSAFRLAFDADDKGYDDEEMGEVSFDRIRALLGDDVFGDDAAAKLQNLQRSLRKVWQHSTSEPVGEIPETEPQLVKDFYDVTKELSDKGEINLAELNKELCFRQANVLMMLDGPSLAFFEEHKNDENFALLWTEFVKKNSSKSVSVNRLKNEDKDVVTAEKVEYKIDANGHLRTDYSDLNGSGLDITVVDGKLSILTKTNDDKPVEEISYEQYNALETFLFGKGLRVAADESTKQFLEEVKVVLKDRDEAALGNLLKDASLIEDEEVQGREDAEHIEGPYLPERKSKQEENEAENEITGESSGALKDDGLNYNTYQFIVSKAKKELTREDHKAAREKFIKEFNKEHIDHRVKTRLGIGGFEIVCWGSEEDERNDGKIDPKTGIKKHTKLFGCRFRYGPPPTATLIEGNLRKLSSTDAAAILKGLKASGAEYVIIPDKSKIGSEAYKNMLIGCIKSGVAPKLGAGGTKGFGQGEAASMWKTFKETDKGADDKIDIAMRLAEQMQIHASTPDEKGKCEDLGDFPDFFLSYARFHKFTDSYVSSLNELVGVKTKEAVRGADGKWHLTGEAKEITEPSEVDKICAKAAMTKIIDNLNKGKLPKLDENGNIIKSEDGTIQFEAYNPKENSLEKFQQVMSAYMMEEKPIIFNEIDKEYYGLLKDKESDKDLSGTKEARAVKNIDAKYTTDYKVIINKMKSYQVDISQAEKFSVTSGSKSNLGWKKPEAQITSNNTRGRE